MKIDKESIKICPECGSSFTCQGDNDCWCEKTRIHRKEMLIIMEKYNDCICPACLGKYEEK